VVGPSSTRTSAFAGRVVVAFAAGVTLIAITHAGLGAGHPAGYLTSVAAGADTTVGGQSSPPAAAAATTMFKISGSVKGLFPGSSVPLVLSIVNPQSYPIVVSSITTRVGKTNRPGCSSTFLSVAPFSGAIAVAAKGSAAVIVSVTLSHAAPNACEGAVFPLKYSGSAVGQ
jgi:hypothetical protein